MIRVVLPAHLKTLARVGSEVTLEEVALDANGQLTLAAVLDALESRYPMLRGTIRDQVTHVRRPFVRFFACQEDLTLQPQEFALPAEIVSGAEPLLIIGAIAGG